MSFTPAIPTMRSVDHLALTVPDLENAIAFFVDYFGAEHLYTMGPFADDEGDGMRRTLDVDPKARCTVAMIRLGHHLNLELFEYEAPAQVTTPPRNSDVGGLHLAFYVDDIHAAYEYVKTIPGVEVQEGPNLLPPPLPAAGLEWFYFKTPWGMQMELTSCPDGKFFAGLPAERMARPTKTWR